MLAKRCFGFDAVMDFLNIIRVKMKLSPIRTKICVAKGPRKNAALCLDHHSLNLLSRSFFDVFVLFGNPSNRDDDLSLGGVKHPYTTSRAGPERNAINRDTDRLSF